MARPRRQEQRRSELISAARSAMLEHGPDSVRLNQVAEAAGLTSGAVLYYYPDLRDLLLEANHAGLERFYDARVHMLDTLAGPVEKLVALIRSGLPVGPDDVDVRLFCELGGSAGRHRVYASLLTGLYDRQVGMYQVLLEQGAAQGVFTLNQDAVTIARNLVALEDAYGYRIIARHPVIQAEVAAELILSYARLATGHGLPS